MDDDKITTEKKYHLDGIYSAINNTFLTVGLPRIEDGSGALVYRDCGRAKDFSLFGKIVNTLKKQTWFMDNVAVWRLYDSDDSDSPEDFNEEDLLTHYREKQAMRLNLLERKYFKALNFDLDTHQLQEHYPGANYRQAYDDLRRFFKKHRFLHRQGSGYISEDNWICS